VYFWLSEGDALVMKKLLTTVAAAGLLGVVAAGHAYAKG